MQYTIHPENIPDEAPSKSSNVSWAARKLEQYYIGQSGFQDVLVTVMDSDTHLMPQYFQYLRHAHRRNRESGDLADMTLYLPPIVFDRNAHTVPLLVRVADLMWCAAGLSCFSSHRNSSAVAIPTAVYTIPLSLVHFVGGWDTGPEAIGEDMHMMLKCYFATEGHLKTESVPSPASQCNITTDHQGIRGWIEGHKVRYIQGTRHMWGCLDTGFAFEKWFGLQRKAISNAGTSSQPRPWAARILQYRPHKLWQSRSISRLDEKAAHQNVRGRYTWRDVVLLWRLFEAHFLPAQLFVMILVFATHNVLTQSIIGLKWATVCLSLAGYIRVTNYLVMIVYFAVFYENYHETCVQARERELRKSGLYTTLSSQLSHRNRWNVKYWLDYLVFPLAGLLFGSLCLIQAYLCHFYTIELAYKVSAKPIRAVSFSAKSSTATKIIVEEV